jgi:hypothetical protein
METIEFRKILSGVRRGPGHYGLRWHIKEIVPYLLGCDLMSGGQLLNGFAEVLNRRRGGPGTTNYTWEGELMCNYYGDVRDRKSYRDVSQEESDRILGDLFDELDRFLADQGGTFQVEKADTP